MSVGGLTTGAPLICRGGSDSYAGGKSWAEEFWMRPSDDVAYDGGSRKPAGGRAFGSVDIWQNGQYVLNRLLRHWHVAHIVRPQHSSFRSRTSGFSVSSSYGTFVSVRSVAHVQQASDRDMLEILAMLGNMQ